MLELPVEGESCVDQNELERQRASEETSTSNKHIHNIVTGVHLAKVSGFYRSVVVTWSKPLIRHSLCISIENMFDEEDPYTCKIDLKTWQFWGKKGLKTLKIEDDRRVDVYWDLRTAKLSSSHAEPVSDYYVALVSEGEVVLVLGDQKMEAFKRTNVGHLLEDPFLVHKKENLFGKKFFTTRTILGQGKKEHNIIIESSLSGPFDPEIWISVDGMESVRLTNLHWRFRGNETISVDDVPVYVLYDVHDWLYDNQDSVVGVFVFMQGTCDEGNLAKHLEQRILDLQQSSTVNDGTECTVKQPSNTEFCHFVYAWKTI
ncbi:hypothetical protein Leryth_024717 [Lithospermum erythrorhizon]|nr:hypothetical protein Leryth_024717 [Lithospermum erythrorhizon]